MYRVEIDNKQGNVFKVKAGKNEFEIEPLSENLSPGEVLLASLGSCMGFFTRRYLENAGIPAQGFSLVLEADFSKETPMRFKKIQAVLDLKDTRLDPARKDALLRFVENCPVQSTLKGNPTITLELK
jgi:putative redox protein